MNELIYYLFSVKLYEAFKTVKMQLQIFILQFCVRVIFFFFKLVHSLVNDLQVVMETQNYCNSVE